VQAAKPASDVCPNTGVAIANTLKLIASPEISLKPCLAEIHLLMGVSITDMPPAASTLHEPTRRKYLNSLQVVG
jgi:hypothetical protein